MSDLTLREPTEAPQLLAFYLPQFHVAPENDAWHGRGFTEWSVVAQSKPLYPGHRQPDLPGELGFYDLRVPETRYLQARLAREHGIAGFLYYHYWFGGRQMLGRPFQEVLESGHPDFPFALCWTNESWYRRWRGSLDEMLLEQVFSEEDDIAHIRWLIECFRDPRYIRIDGRPLLTVYRPDLLPDPNRTVELWHRECQRAGVEPPWLVMFETGDESDDPTLLGFDASAEFVPHQLPQLMGTEPLQFGAEKAHSMYEYDAVVSAYLDRPEVGWQRYPCVATAWDNAPRRQTGEALILANSTPASYGRWLSEAATRQSRSAGSNGIVFVNAWNEWAEGAHLEPDVFWGRAYLEVTRDVLRERFGWREPVPDQAVPHHPQTVATADLYNDLYEKFVSLQETSSGFLSYADRRVRELKQHYEARLEQARLEADQVTELNDWLCEQLHLQSGRLQELAVEHVFPTDWLGVGPPAPSGEGAREEGAEQDDGRTAAPPAETHDHDQAPHELANEDAVARNAQKGKRKAQKARRKAYEAKEAEERQRDEGFEEPPRTPTPLWLVELDASD